MEHISRQLKYFSIHWHLSSCHPFYGGKERLYQMQRRGSWSSGYSKQIAVKKKTRRISQATNRLSTCKTEKKALQQNLQEQNHFQWRIQGRGPTPHLIFRPNRGPKSRKKFFGDRAPPLSKGLDHAPPSPPPSLSQGLDPAFTLHFVTHYQYHQFLAIKTFLWNTGNLY